MPGNKLATLVTSRVTVLGIRRLLRPSFLYPYSRAPPLLRIFHTHYYYLIFYSIWPPLSFKEGSGEETELEFTEDLDVTADIIVKPVFSI